MKKILVVDDAPINRELLTDILSDLYEVDTACNGQEVIDKINAGNNYNLILLDLGMPVLDGFGVLDYMLKNGLTPMFPVIIISGDKDAETESKCFDYFVADFIAKPFREKVILKRVENVLYLQEYQRSLEGQIEKKNKELELQNRKLMEQAIRLEETNFRIIDVLGNIVESRNLESGVHVKRVRGFTKILAKQYMRDYPDSNLTIDAIEMISQASALHDIGKISIPDNILLKPDRLTEDEFEVMKTHTIKGCDVLDNIEGIWDDEYQKICYEICKYHHERYDGKGYPCKLSGDDIPLSAQLVSIADCYDALVTERVYKKAFSKDIAFEMIMDGKCGTFSPKVLNAFSHAKNAFEEYTKLCEMKS